MEKAILISKIVKFSVVSAAASLGALAVAPHQAQAASFIIDPFDVAQVASTTTTTDVSNGPLVGNGSVFTNRTLSIDAQTNVNGNEFKIQSGTGILDITKGTNSRGTFTATYSGSIVNFSQNGANDRFIFNFLESNYPPADVTLSVTDSDGTVGTYTIPNIGFIPTGSPEDKTALFSSFSNFANLDFTAISQFSILVNTTDLANGADLNLDFVSTDVNPDQTPVSVPEPATMLGILAFGSLGLLNRRRKF